ncbi:hypothetical protein Ndes2526B_g03650 [Nannochloris sp. 'desiccata']
MTSPLLEDEHLAPPLPASDDEPAETRRPWARLGEQIRAPFASRRIEPEPPTPSGYLTLIPLSDARLQPRDTRLTAVFLIGFAFLIAAIVFISVPRSVSVGEISVAADRMSWNTTKASYQLRLVATIPVSNPNYLRASIEGELKVLFYMAEAGRAVIAPVSLNPRALPKLVHAQIDASDVPADYILSILSQCSTFPEVLVFFLKGKLRARYLWQYQHLATIDTYFMINCRDGGTVPAAEKNETAMVKLGIGGGAKSSGGLSVPVRLTNFM